MLLRGMRKWRVLLTMNIEESIRDYARLKSNERKRKWTAENKEKHRECCKKWQSENQEKVKEYKAMWQAKNREKVRAYNRKWYEKKKAERVHHEH